MIKFKSYFQTRQSIVKALVAIVLLAIILNQTFWLISMHNIYHTQLTDRINQSVQDAVWAELSERREEMGGFQAIYLSKSNYKDSPRYVNKEVVTADSIFNVIIDRQDIYSTEKIIQLAIMDIKPINLNNLSSIFNTIVSEHFAIKCSYFDYIDINSGTLIESNKPLGNVGVEYHKTDTITLDINDSIAVVGYANISKNEILVKMLWQLILSVTLIIVAIVGIIYISRNFIWQWRTEMMRQDSIYAMMHEFKRPISAAMLKASLISYYFERNFTETALQYSESINEELVKLTKYIDTIKQISNSENIEIILNKTEVDINVLLSAIKARFKTVSDTEQTININLEMKSKKNVVYIDVVHFSNVIENLIENAIKYNTNNPVNIIITVSDFNNQHLISVKDNGIGIPTKGIKHIFRRYYRENQNKVKARPGYGLGLTYVKLIIEAHRGSISVESELNKGSRFDIII